MTCADVSGVGPLSKGTGHSHMTVLISMGSVRSGLNGLKQSEFSSQSDIDLSRKRNICKNEAE